MAVKTGPIETPRQRQKRRPQSKSPDVPLGFAMWFKEANKPPRRKP